MTHRKRMYAFLALLLSVLLPIEGALASTLTLPSDVSFPDGVASIGDYAFYACESLTSVSIPASVTYIGEQAFGNCSNLTTVYFGGTPAQWAAVMSDLYETGLGRASIVYGASMGN